MRRLAAVESLGSCTVIASDKTGTLTINEQTAKIIMLLDGSQYSIKGQGYNGVGAVFDQNGKKAFYTDKPELKEIVHISIFSNEGSLTERDNKWIYHGDAMDVALLGMCYKFGVNPEELIGSQKLSAEFHMNLNENFPLHFMKPMALFSQE